MHDNSELPSGLHEGDLIAGKYRIESLLGAGGMGVVVAAHHVDLDERVAIKLLLPETITNEEAVARFAREARAAVKIKSEHVARVSDVGTLENGAPFIVMEYLDGSDLSRFLDEHGRLPVEQAVEFVLQASEAVAEAHALGIVHRDLKPANLFVIRRPDGLLSVKVLDFGISKLTGAIGANAGISVTKTSALMGSPLYMSPEQMRSAKDIDSRSDIWSLGIILYELLAGEPAFKAETMPELVLQIANEPPAPLLGHRPDLPAGLEAAIMRCLEKYRERRFQTVAELAVALVPFGPRRARESAERISGVIKAAGLAVDGAPAPPSSDERSPATQTMSPFGRTSNEPSRGNRTLLGLATLAGFAALATTVVIFRSVLSPGTPAHPAAGSSAPAVTTPQLIPSAKPETATPPPSTAASEAPIVEPAAAARETATATETADPTETAAVRPPLGAVRPSGNRPRPGASASHPTPPKTPTQQSRPNPNCEQNYYLDANGEKHFKHECFPN